MEKRRKQKRQVNQKHITGGGLHIELLTNVAKEDRGTGYTADGAHAAELIPRPAVVVNLGDHIGQVAARRDATIQGVV
jgi:hypothetical protein